MFKSFGWPEIALILVIILIVFGVGKLPQVGGAIGKAIKNFKNAQKDNTDDEEEGDDKLKSPGKSEEKNSTK